MNTLRISAAPGLGMELPSELRQLRERVLALHQGPKPPLPEQTLSDASQWAAHTEDENWLLWRAQRVAGRLGTIPFDLFPGESIVGVPLLREPTPEQAAALEKAKGVLATMPPHPGGDAGHFHPNYERLFSGGIRGILEEIDARQSALPAEDERRVFYEACRIAARGLSAFVRRAGGACQDMATEDLGNRRHWLRMAALCERISLEPPATFHEAIQLMFLTLSASWYGEDHGQGNLGRMDQTLGRFYEADLAAGRITPQRAFELLSNALINMNRLHWPGGAVAVIVGGKDSRGEDATNDLTYLCLAARLATRLVYPTVAIAWHRQTPSDLMDFAVRMLGHGCGDPAFFNDEVIAEGLRRRGVREEDCHNFMNSTCVEIKVAGNSNIWVASPYFNLTQGVLDVLDGVVEGRLAEADSFEGFCEQVRANLAARIREAAERLDRIWRERERTGCFPLASCLIDDCLERGLDHDRGGARYNWVENSCVGLANLADSLVAIRRLVYEEKSLTLGGLRGILKRDFEGHEPLRQRILNDLPHYGNDDEEADGIARDFASFLIDSTESNTVGLSPYCPGFFCWIQHEKLGSATGASPDGRKAGQPFADGAGAAQGRESRGPTASVLSSTKWSHVRALGGLVQNLKMSGRMFQAADSRRAVRGIIETYLLRGGFEIQMNVVGRDALIEAQKNPERHRDLLVRVAGYSDYFVHLNRNTQDEVIARTEHAL